MANDLRKAAEMALEAFEMLDRRGGLGLDVHKYIRTKTEALRQALAQPVDAVNTSQERVDETAKGEHDLWIAAACLKSTVEAAIKAGDWKVDGACDPDSAIMRLRQALAQEKNNESLGLATRDYIQVAKVIEAKLQEKNT